MADNGQVKAGKVFSGLYQGLYVLVKIAVLALFVLACYFGARAAYRFGYTVFTTGTVEAAPGRDVSVTIGLDMNDRSVGVYLKEIGVIKNSWVFFVQAKIYGYKILPGSYVLNTSQTVAEMLEILSTPAEAP
ncbi:MAG: hypothetical protein ILP12_06915 [Lachnospiraceae bacterium]|nr:hypothetical protein [Lachnospiraceae bacterium]